MVIARRLLTAIAACAIVTGSADASVHPLHTTLAQLQYDASRRELTVSLRVFTDDFSAAVSRHARARLAAGASPPVAAMYRYVTSRFILTDAAGKPVSLDGCGVRRASELLFICLRASVATPPTGMRLRNALLVEWFDDQVNIVQYVAGSARRTTMFTPGDGAKRLP
ncbi:MAG: DUF6702 family protein [Gemmatimonas sp.]